MDLLSNIVLNTFSILILVTICLYYWHFGDKGTSRGKIYLSTVLLTIFLLIIDVLSRLEGQISTVRPFLNHYSNFIMFLLAPALSSLWVLFVYYYTYKKEQKKPILFYLLAFINILNVILVILNLSNGWFYSIDSNNIYTRGPLFVLSTSFVFIQIIIATIIILINRKRTEPKHFFALLFFIVPPLTCIILQITILDISFSLNGVALSLLIIFLFIQNQDIFTDYLTGINNRRKLELVLNKKIKETVKGKSFSAIMIDLDGFKSINDTYGHQTGDEVLWNVAKLLRSSVPPNGFISRYGGDEFWIILDISKEAKLQEAVNRIKQALEDYNMTNSLPFSISLSMGYAVYDYQSTLSTEEFQHQIDKKMYEDKKK